jgi:hypothetical protein
MRFPTPHISGRSTAKWDVLNGERQTNKLFDHEIVERMGAEFYRDVFEPAVRTAREQRQSYEAIVIASYGVGSRRPATEVFERNYPSRRRTVYEHPIGAIALCTQSAGGLDRPAVPPRRAAAPRRGVGRKSVGRRMYARCLDIVIVSDGGVECPSAVDPSPRLA